MECKVKKADVVQQILRGAHESSATDKREQGVGYAPTNIALCKYWGKRDTELNLPVTPSLSIALPDKGAMTTLRWSTSALDVVTLNGKELAAEDPFVTRLVSYLDLFRTTDKWHLQVDIKMNLPVAAGLASSACGFASLVAAMNDLMQWQLIPRDLSLLARMGSGSAARSLWNGFVYWHEGIREDGLDSFGEPLECEWPTLRVGILPISDAQKPISSRDAMLRTVNSSALYGSWPRKVSQDLSIFKQARISFKYSRGESRKAENAVSGNSKVMVVIIAVSRFSICKYCTNILAV